MQQFKNILVFTDGGPGEDQAITHAAELAAANKARLTLFDVLESSSTPPASAELTALVDSHQKDLLKDRHSELAEKASAIREQHTGIIAESFVRRGGTAIEVVRQVLRSGHDLVIKAAEGRVGRRHALFGSTEKGLLRNCPCPVWLIKPSGSERCSRILAAVELKLDFKDRDSLDRQIMSLASALAIQNDAELHVVHVWKLAYEHTLRGRSILSNTVDNLLAEMESTCQKQLDELLAEFPNLNAETHLIKGDPEDVIPDLVRDIKVDQIVMGTVARVGVPGFIIGNTAETILNDVDCSVLAIKPAGFKTPVSASET